MECRDICSGCPWDKPAPPLVEHLNGYLEMQDGKCPIGRHELLDEHWQLLGYMKVVREEYRYDRAKELAAQKKTREAGG